MILNINNNIAIKIKIIILLFLCVYKSQNKLKTIHKNNISPNFPSFNRKNKASKIFHRKIKKIDDLIDNLNYHLNEIKQTNIIFHDYFLSKSCFDKNSYYLFDYFLENNIGVPYYIINQKSDFYRYLRNQSKAKNLILFDPKKLSIFYRKLYKYLKETKIIVASYTIGFMQKIAAYVPYIKFLKIDHGIKHFKIWVAKNEIFRPLRKKAKLISSSPYEYKLLIKELKYNPSQIYNASLIRYERFQHIKKSDNEKKCLLVSFTYRPYNKFLFEKSKYKTNLLKFLNDKELINELSNRNINLIYIPHHEEVDLGKKYLQKYFKYAIIGSQQSIEHYIEQCSLMITDFSSLSFDFMFQNKPVLFYSLDKDDKLNYNGKKYAKYHNDTLFFGNYFSEQISLIKKINFYIKNNFDIGNELKRNYDSVFFIKTNIIKKVVDIIKQIISIT